MQKIKKMSGCVFFIRKSSTSPSSKCLAGIEKPTFIYTSLVCETESNIIRILRVYLSNLLRMLQTNL